MITFIIVPSRLGVFDWLVLQGQMLVTWKLTTMVLGAGYVMMGSPNRLPQKFADF